MNFASHKITGLKLPSPYDPNNMWRDLSQMKEKDVRNYMGEPEDIAMYYFKFKIGYSEKWKVEQPFEHPSEWVFALQVLWCWLTTGKRYEATFLEHSKQVIGLSNNCVLNISSPFFSKEER